MTVQVYERQLVGNGSVDDPADRYLQQMVAAAEVGNETQFIMAKQAIDWQQRPAADFRRAIRWALAAGAHMAARNLAQEGANLHPSDQELQKFAYLLAPPKVIARDLPPDPAIRANRDWLRIHRVQYRGQWVALRNGELLATAASLHALTQQFGITRNILFTKVF